MATKQKQAWRVKAGRKGGQATRGYPFAHGKLNPSETGKMGGRPVGPHKASCNCISCGYKKGKSHAST